MSSVSIIATREYRQIATTRGFWITLLLVPLAILASTLVTRLAAAPRDVVYTIVDMSGRYAASLDRRVEVDYQRRGLSEVAAYAQAWRIKPGPIAAAWSDGPSWYNDDRIDRFIAMGGVEAAGRAVNAHRPHGAPEFLTPQRMYRDVALPSGLDDGDPVAFGAVLNRLFQTNIPTPSGPRTLALAIYIPKDFGAGSSPVRMWTNGSSVTPLIDTMREELARAARRDALGHDGLSTEETYRVERLAVPMQVIDPPAGGGRDGLIIRSIVPLALVYLLLVTMMTTGGMLLQGMIEERSNKLLESLLACVSPSELMYGKLVGLGAVGLTIILFWAACAIAAVSTSAGIVTTILRPSLSALDQPWIVAALIFYFLSGYLIISMIYLAIGSVCSSIQEAQAFLMPVMVVITLPVLALVTTSVSNPGSMFAKVMSWIPIYTPFAMLARLVTGVTMSEVQGTAALVLGFIWLESILLGRLFEANLLNTGQPPTLVSVIRMMGRRS